MLLIQLIIITSIWCLGVKIITAEGMILQKLGVYAKQQVDKGNIVWDALVNCEWCLASIHSLLGYLFALGIGVITKFEWRLIFMYPLVAMGTSLLTGMIWNYHLKSNSEKEANEGIRDATEIFIENMINSEETEADYEKRVYHNQNN